MKADYFRRKSSKHLDNLRKSESMLDDVRNFVNALKQRSEKSSSGSNLLDFTTYETITQLTDSTTDLAKQLAIGDELSALFKELLRERASVEKRRPSKTADKVDLTFPIGNEVDENDNICARPDRMMLDSDDDIGDGANGRPPEEEDEGQNTSGIDEVDNNEENNDIEEHDEKTSKKPFVAQKRLAMAAPAVLVADEHQRVNRIHRRLLKSSLVKDLRSQYSDAPLEINAHDDILDGDDAYHAAEKSQRKFEEDYFIRLSAGKRQKMQKHAQTRKMERGGMDQLLSFGNYRLPGADETDGEESAMGGGKGRQGRPDKGQKRRRGADDGNTPARKFMKKHGRGGRAKKAGGGGRKRARFM